MLLILSQIPYPTTFSASLVYFISNIPEKNVLREFAGVYKIGLKWYTEQLMKISGCYKSPSVSRILFDLFLYLSHVFIILFVNTIKKLTNGLFCDIFRIARLRYP